MGDFFTPPGGFPFVPEEPATPPPDFASIAQSWAVGSEAAKKELGWWADLGDWILTVVAKIFGFFLSLGLKAFAFMMKVFGDVTDEASAGYGAVVAASLHELFGVTVSPASVNTRAGGSDRAAVAASLGQAIIGTLFSSAGASGATGIPPSDAAANNFLRVTMNMELNGWLESMFTDAVSYHLLEKYGDLKDGIAHVLGLGRMSRQVFAAPIKILVHDPYTALLNQKYRPKAVDVGTAMRAFNRGDTDRAGLTKLLSTQGFTEQEIDWLVIDHTKYLPNEDVDYLVARNIWTHQQATDYLRHQGWDAAGSQYVLQVLEDKRLQKYRNELVATATDGYVRGEVNDAQLAAAIQSAGVPSTEQLWVANVAQARRDTHVTHLSLGQIETAIKDGVMNFNDLKAWALRNNMPLDEETFLELTLLVDESKAAAAKQKAADAAKAKAAAAAAKVQAAAAKAAAAAAAAPDKGVSIAQAEALVKSGDWTFAQLSGFLTSRGYGADAIESIETLLHEQMAAKPAQATKAAGVRAAATAKGLNLAQVEKAVVEGILSADDLARWLTAQGFDAADSAVILAETQHAVDDAKLRAATRAAASAAAGKKGISLPALERAVRLGIAPISDYTAALQRADFDDASVSLLTDTLRALMAKDAAAKAGKGTGTAVTAVKTATLPQIEQEVIAGVRPIADYSAALKAAGYGDTDVEQLTDVVYVKAEHAAHAHQLHSDAVGVAADRGIPLAKAEAAVIAGINQMSDYDAMLTTLGFDDADRATLEALLLAKVNAKANAPAKKPPAPTPPA